MFYQHFGQREIIRGAHFKTYDFYKHIQSIDGYDPIIVFDNDSYWHEGLPWYSMFSEVPRLERLKVQPDIYFLNSGKDWIKISEHRLFNKNKPVVSPVNHFKAVNPDHPAFKFLSCKAVRLCPSPELFNAINDHEQTNGPVLYVPNGVSTEGIEFIEDEDKTYDVAVVGQKNPSLAKEIYVNLKRLNLKVILLDNWLSKKEFQERLADVKFTIHLPKAVEAHYIPAIESMMLGSVVIMPHCTGNASYAINLETCLVTEYTLESIVEATVKAQKLNKELLNSIKNRAFHATQLFSMRSERKNIERALNLAID